jgi:hypothetical protein
LAQAEREHILAVLRDTDWVLGGPKGAASRLGMKRSTLHWKMKKLDISRPQQCPVIVKWCKWGGMPKECGSCSSKSCAAGASRITWTCSPVTTLTGCGGWRG